MIQLRNQSKYASEGENLDIVFSKNKAFWKNLLIAVIGTAITAGLLFLMQLVYSVFGETGFKIDIIMLLIFIVFGFILDRKEKR